MYARGAGAVKVGVTAGRWDAQPPRRMERAIAGWKPACSATLVLGGRPRPQSRERIIEAVRA
ncbi:MULTISPECIES: hypothetical protein [Nocardia]|uniref:hypothetical protein n=1 Tax=Nocardia TaxID=1817 RepID=UPI0011B08915|nr:MULTISPECIES: hypothetical protein [Nocardia]MBF6277493.1 hypothetical protein [Nocardia nova]